MIFAETVIWRVSQNFTFKKDYARKKAAGITTSGFFVAFPKFQTLEKVFHQHTLFHQP